MLNQNLNNYFYLTHTGGVEYFSKGKLVREFTAGDFIGEMLAASGYASSHTLKAKTATILLKVKKDSAYVLLADKITLTEKFLEFI